MTTFFSLFIGGGGEDTSGVDDDDDDTNYKLYILSHAVLTYTV